MRLANLLFSPPSPQAPKPPSPFQERWRILILGFLLALLPTEKTHAQGFPCTVFFVSATTDLPAVPIRPFCNASGFNVTATIGHDDGCTSTGGDIYVIIEAQLKAGAVESRFNGSVTNNPNYFSDIVYTPDANAPQLSEIHKLGNSSRTAILFRFRRTFPETVSSETFTFPFTFEPNFFFGDIPWNVWVAATPPDNAGVPVLPALPPDLGAPFGGLAGTINFEAPYFPIIGSNNSSTFDDLLRHSWANSDHDGEAHSIMLLPGQELTPVLTIDAIQFVHGFTSQDRGKLYLCPGGQVKVPSGTEYILTQSDVFTCTGTSKGILVENGGRVFLSSATIKDAEVGVTAKKGSNVESFNARFDNNYKAMRLDNTGNISIPDIIVAFTGANFFFNTATLKPPYPGMATPNTTKGYGLEIISHPNVVMGSGTFQGLNNGVRLYRSSFTTRATFAGIRADAGSTVPFQGWAIWGFGSGAETLSYEIGSITALGQSGNTDKGIYVERMNATVNKVRITANEGISLKDCKLKDIQITNSPALNCRSYAIKSSNCIPLLATSIIRDNSIVMSNPGNNNLIGTGILLGEGSNITTPGAVSWIVQNNFIDLDRTHWGIRGIGVNKAEFRNNDIEFLNGNLANVIGMDVLSSNKMLAYCNDVHTTASEILSQGYLFKNVNQSDYICNTTDQLAKGMEFSTLCEGTTLKGSNFNSTPNGLRLKNNVALGTQGLDLMNPEQDHGNKWEMSSAFHEASTQDVVDMSRFGVDPVENPAFKPVSNWPSWFKVEPTPNTPSFSCSGFQCTQTLASVKDRGVERSVADGTIFSVGLPGVTPNILEKHLYAELQQNPAWAASDPVFAQFLQNKYGTSIAALWQIQQGIDALNNRTASEQSAVSAIEASINSLRHELYLLDSTYASGTAINHAHYTLRLAQLSAATGSLQTQLDNLRNARITLAAQLLTQNAAIGATQTWEQHEKLVNELEIRIFMQDSVNNTQLALLDALGTLCPDDNGEAVLRAQVLYNRFVEKEFSPVCTGARGGTGDRTKDGTEKTAAFSVYPNPTTGILSISGLNATGFQAEVIDISGRKLVSMSLSDNTLDLSSLSPGIYFVRLMQPEGEQIGISKIVISK